MLTLHTPTAAAGTAHLQFTLGSGGTTVLTRSFATSPVKLLATRNGGVSCWVYAATLGGGLVGGDAIRMDVDVQQGACALVTTQASTKVYRSRYPCTQTVCATVADGGLLALIPDPIVCYAEADFAQTQRYDLRANANVAIVDWMTSGRHASGERWAFSRYVSRLAISRDGRPVLYDAIALESDLDSVRDRMGRFDVFLTAILTGPLLSQPAAAILDDVSRRPISRDADVVVSASRTTDGGTLLRMAGASVERIGRSLREFLRCLYPLLGDDPWSRKW